MRTFADRPADQKLRYAFSAAARQTHARPLTRPPGINSQISQVVYDPVQALVAVGTNDTKYGPGQIYVFGQKRVEVVLPLPHRASVKILQFCADRLLCVDSRNDLSIFSLDTKRLINAHSPPAKITALHSDPTLDYALLGTQTGMWTDGVAQRHG